MAMPETNPYNFYSDPKKWKDWEIAKAAERAEADKKAEAKSARSVKKQYQANLPEYKDEGMSSMMIAALVVGGGALLYLILKKKGR